MMMVLYEIIMVSAVIRPLDYEGIGIKYFFWILQEFK